jgi:hypothetical protein
MKGGKANEASVPHGERRRHARADDGRHGGCDDLRSERERGTARAGHPGRAGRQPRHDPDGGWYPRGGVLRAADGASVVRRALLGVTRRKGWVVLLLLPTLFLLPFVPSANADLLTNSPLDTSEWNNITEYDNFFPHAKERLQYEAVYAERATPTAGTFQVSQNEFQKRLNLFGNASAYNGVTPTANQVEKARGIQKWLWRARMSAGQIPKLRALSSVAMGVMAFDFGWQIGRNIDTHFLHFSGNVEQMGTSGASGLPAAAAWKFYYHIGTVESGTTVSCATQGASQPWPADCDGNVWRIVSGANVRSGFNGTSSYTAGSDWHNFLLNSTGSAVHVRTLNPAYCGGFTQCIEAYLTEDEMEQILKVKEQGDISARSHGGLTIINYPGTFTVPQGGGTISDANLENFAQTMKSGSTTARKWGEHITHPDESYPNPLDSDGLPDCRGAIVAVCVGLLEEAGFLTHTVITLDNIDADLTVPAGNVVETYPPATTEVALDTEIQIFINPDPLPIQILAPLANETYDHYVARLQGIGWLGEATRVDLSEATADPMYGPEAVPRTIPVVGTKIGLEDPITFYVNPPTVPRAPEDPETGLPPGGTVPNPNCDGYLTAEPDFSPLSVGLSDKFPFGLFAYVGALLSPLVSSPVTPSWDIDIVLPHVGTFPFEGDLHRLDNFMAFWRGLLTVAIIGAAIYFLASSVLGFNSRNSAGDAVDEDAW